MPHTELTNSTYRTDSPANLSSHAQDKFEWFAETPPCELIMLKPLSNPTANWFVRAEPKYDKVVYLRERLDRGEIGEIDPFCRAMTKALENARFDPKRSEAVWIEEEYCCPPLAMERTQVLDER